MRLIDAEPLIDGCADMIAIEWNHKIAPISWADAEEEFKQRLEEAPTIDAAPVVQYNDLRDDFIDYVCSGVQNPAPYCGNATEKCVDARGWCVNNECNGFTPRGERKE